MDLLKHRGWFLNIYFVLITWNVHINTWCVWSNALPVSLYHLLHRVSLPTVCTYFLTQSSITATRIAEYRTIHWEYGQPTMGHISEKNWLPTPKLSTGNGSWAMGRTSYSSQYMADLILYRSYAYSLILWGRGLICNVHVIVSQQCLFHKGIWVFLSLLLLF